MKVVHVLLLAALAVSSVSDAATTPATAATTTTTTTAAEPDATIPATEPADPVAKTPTTGDSLLAEKADDKSSTTSADEKPVPKPKSLLSDDTLSPTGSLSSSSGDTTPVDSATGSAADVPSDSASAMSDLMSVSASASAEGLEKPEEDEGTAQTSSDEGPTGEGGGAIPPRLVPLPSSSSDAMSQMTATLGSVAAVVIAVGAYFL